MTDCGCFSHGSFLTERGLKEASLAQQISLEGLLPRGVGDIVDRIGSVSGLELERDTLWMSGDQTDEQARRFHHGS